MRVLDQCSRLELRATFHAARPTEIRMTCEISSRSAAGFVLAGWPYSVG